jgi:hypothetical protein
MEMKSLARYKHTSLFACSISHKEKVVSHGQLSLM